MRNIVGIACTLLLMNPVSVAAADEVDIAVDAVFMAGAIAGVPVGGLDKEIVKSLVRCAVRGSAVSLVGCSQELVIERLPPEAQSFARCLMKGDDVDRCAEGEMLRRGVPPEALQLARCVATRPDFKDCVAIPGSNAAQAAALRVVDGLKADARSRVERTAIHSILDVATGIRNNDWFLVAQAAGPEVYQAALQAALTLAAPYLAPVSPYLQPTLRNVAEARVDQVNNIVRAARSGNAARLAEALVTAYLTSEKLICMVDQVPQELRDLTCGTFSKVTAAVAGAAGDAVTVVGDALSDAWDSTAGGREILDGKNNSCGTASGHYLDKYASCYHVGAYFLLNPGTRARFDEMQLNLRQECRERFDQCHFSSRLTPICQPMEDTFDKQVKEMAAKISTAARLYVSTFSDFVNHRFRRPDGTTDTAAACQADALQRAEDTFRNSCVTALRAQYGPERRPIVQVCGLRVGEPFNESVYDAACRGALKRTDTPRSLAVHRACHPPKPLSAPSACAGQASCDGEVTISCSSPMTADRYVVQATRRAPDGSVDATSGVIQTSAEPKRGALSVNLTPGDYSLQVCASDGVASKCGGPFTLTIGEHKCVPRFSYPPAKRQCPAGQSPCGAGCSAKCTHQPIK